VYFRKIFKSIYGVSPIKYINNLKIEHARELIESQMYSISEAAFHSGYSDSSSFSRDFKKHFDMTPGEYMRMAKN
jgi:AraC-like DNA-binding protein